MKANNPFLLLFSVLLISCSGMRSINFKVPVPPQIQVNEQIQTLVIVDRQVESKDSRIEGVITGETKNQDALSLAESIRAIKQTLEEAERFAISIEEQKWPSNQPNIFRFGTPLSWEEVRHICGKHNAQAVISIEYFDSDFNVTNGRVEANNGSLLGIGFSASGRATAKAGLRIYDLANQMIIYEDQLFTDRNWQTNASNIVEAVNKMVNRDEAVRQIGYDLGLTFGQSLIPTYQLASREFYKGKSDLMRKGSKLAELKNFSEALKAWKEALPLERKSKDKGRCAYNMAVAYEMLGNLEQAKKWATVAYADYGEKRGREYGQFLNRKIERQRRNNEED